MSFFGGVWFLLNGAGGFLFKVFIFLGLFFGAWLKVYLNYARDYISRVLLFFSYFMFFS